jgi:hypothetical protein
MTFVIFLVMVFVFGTVEGGIGKGLPHYPHRAALEQPLIGLRGFERLHHLKCTFALERGGCED